jgi:pyridoxal phosphate enzyme (YggS family)
MHDIVNRLLTIKKEIQSKNSTAEIIAIAKTFPIKDILPLINYGHHHFGENKVQEAMQKWTDIKKDFKNIKLHMVGKLQTNKVKFVVGLFDYIHSLDNIKLAKKISFEQKKLNKKIKIFIQVNIGNENQKSGLVPDKVNDFFSICTKELDLKIIGLMCLPPNNEDSSKYFKEMKKLLLNTQLSQLSMGMSNDYLEAIDYSSTFLRIGSKIFGERN